MARNDPQVNLRMPEGLKEQLLSSAEANKRSLTAEIMARLQFSLELDAGTSGTVIKLPPDLKSDLMVTARASKETLDKVVVDRLALTFRFDEEVGWAEQIKEGMGPIAGIIDHHLTALEESIQGVRATLEGELIDKLIELDKKEP